MTEEELKKYNVFLIPIGTYLGKDAFSYYLIYAPLVRNMMVADVNGLSQLDYVLSNLVVKGNVSRFFSKIHRVADLQKMSILPNHTCNFNCSYCYSAKGRSNVVLEKEKLQKGLEFFIDSTRLTERNISISFIGGGEPLLSWDLVRFGIEYADKLAINQGFHLTMTLITNGSIMTEEIIHVLKEYHVLPDVSFDIMEEAQNKNRKSFDKVCRTIDLLSEHDLAPSVNATITPDTVKHMSEMFEFMHLRFPKVKNMVFEPVVSDTVFKTAAQLHEFYEAYIDNFFLAKNLAVKYDKNVTCRIFKNIDSLLERGCPSKFTLTPQGDLSICYCSSSPKEKKYSERVYGYVTKDKVYIDEDKFKGIHGINVYSYAKCDNCFAKWHCAGGCMCPNDLYTEDYLNEVCNFTKELVKRTLLERLEKQMENEYGCSLRDYCLNN